MQGLEGLEIEELCVQYKPSTDEELQINPTDPSLPYLPLLVNGSVISSTFYLNYGSRGTKGFLKIRHKEQIMDGILQYC